MSSVDPRALREALDASLVGVAILGDDGTYEYVNDAHVDVYGYESEAAFLGESWELCYTDEQRAALDEAFRVLDREGRWRGELEGVRADGSTFHQELSLSTLASGGLVCVVRDITEQRQHEFQLEALNEGTRALMGATDLASVAETVLDIAAGVLGETMLAVWLERDRGACLEPVAATTEARAVSGPADAAVPPIEPGSREWRAFDDGEPWFAADYGAVPTEDRSFPDTPLGSVAVLPLGDHGVLSAGRRSVDEFTRSQRDVMRVLSLNATAALDRAERRAQLEATNERLDQFASVVSHDLRGPLSVIRGNAELAKETGEERYVDEVLAAADRMDRLVDDLLTLARQGDTVGEFRAVSLERLARRAWSAVPNGDADVTVDAAATVSADPDRLQELLENLFRNSVEHATGGDRTVCGDGVDRATGGERETTSVSVTVRAAPDAGRFSVADDGPGIPPDERDAVFEHGYSTSDDGTGFGLAIVDRIAEAHGWGVELADSAAGGARFEFTGVEFED